MHIRHGNVSAYLGQLWRQAHKLDSLLLLSTTHQTMLCDCALAGTTKVRGNATSLRSFLFRWYAHTAQPRCSLRLQCQVMLSIYINTFASDHSHLHQQYVH